MIIEDFYSSEDEGAAAVEQFSSFRSIDLTTAGNSRQKEIDRETREILQATGPNR